MSLFADNQYRWRETYFVLFKSANRPSLEAMQAMLRNLGSGYESDPLMADDDGVFESVTIRSPFDFAAMDVTCISGEDVSDQVQQLEAEMAGMPLSDAGRAKLAELHECDARFEIYHFEQITEGDGYGDDDGFLDPGSLITILRRLATLTHGIGIDPQTGLLI